MEKRVRKTTLREQDREDRDFWRSRSPKARIAAVTLLVNRYFGLDDELPERLQRPLTVAKRSLR